MFKVYRPNQRLETNIFVSWYEMLKNTYKSRELIWQLFRRDFLMSYKKSFIGVGWIVLAPIFAIVSWVFMNSTGVLDPGDTGIPYPAYVLLSTAIWGLFMGYFSSASGTLGAGEGFIMQVNYPHEALLAKQLLQHTANFLITFLINLVVLALLGVFPSWGIILFPLTILPLLFLGSAIGLILSVIGIVAVDISNIANKAMGLLLFITPVIYAPENDNELLQTIIDYNPLTYLISGSRDMLLYGRIENFPIYMGVSVITLLVFLIASRLFYVSESLVIEKMI